MKMRIRSCGCHDLYDGAITYGLNNKSRLDKLCSLLLALCPILQHYNGMYMNAGYTAVILVSPYLILNLLYKIKNGKNDSQCFYALIPMMLFQFFKMADHKMTVSKIFYAAFIMTIFIAAVLGSVNIKYFIKSATIICFAATICLIIQYILWIRFSSSACADITSAAEE